MESIEDSAFRLLDWDSAHFGMRIGRVLPNRGDERLFQEASAWADRSSLECMYLLADSDHAATVRLASECGWRMVDVRVTLGAELSRMAKSPAPMRQAYAGDLPYLQELARRSHTDSRFYADGNFPAAACDDLFAAWIERSVLDRGFAGAVLVAELAGNEPAGYVTCSVRHGAGEIGLIAVDPKAHRRGLGTRLLAEAARWCSEQAAERVTVVTQGCNIPALRMYQRCGFTIESLRLWFHWWRGRGHTGSGQ